MAVGNVKGFKVKKGSETGIAKIATEAYLDGSVTKAKLSQPVQTEINKIANKADIDGDYDSLTAGGAKQLLSTVYVDDNEPYNFRTAGGSADIGDRVYEEVVGGSIVWNQKVRSTRSAGTLNGLTITTNNSDLSVTFVGTSTKAEAYTIGATYASEQIEGHVYLVSAGLNSTNDYWVRASISNNSPPVGKDGVVVKHNGNVIAANLNVADGVEVNITVHANIVDLTQMFGSTIADYIYSLEQGTAGAGVAWFRNLFPKPYYEYNTGTLMSVKAGAHNTVGFNAWDEQWEVGTYNSSGGKATATDRIRSKNYIPVVPNATYCIHAPVGGCAVLFYDADKNFVSMTSGLSMLSNATFTVPSNACYLTFFTYANYGATYKNDICINLSWDGERNGEYEPYEKHEYPLDELELRGIPKLDANNQLYYDGDTYASDGTVTRRYDIVDLGTCNYTKSSSGTGCFYGSLPSGKNYGLGASVGMLCTQYQQGRGRNAQPYYPDTDKTFNYWIRGSGSGSGYGPSELYFVDTAKDSMTAEQFKQAMSGVVLVYEVWDATTETADSFVSPQIVNDFGTEEYTDYAVEAGDRDVAIPVGHNSQYMNNLRAKLEMAPESPDGDGKYIVQQSNGENAYIPYTADGRLDVLEAKVPVPPSTNGTYKLTATVTDGSVVYAWVAG